jgi:hypothetical protein
MWASAVALLSEADRPDLLPLGWPNPWGGREVLDPTGHRPVGMGGAHAAQVVKAVVANLAKMA